MLHDAAEHILKRVDFQILVELKNAPETILLHDEAGESCGVAEITLGQADQLPVGGLEIGVFRRKDAKQVDGLRRTGAAQRRQRFGVAARIVSVPSGDEVFHGFLLQKAHALAISRTLLRNQLLHIVHLRFQLLNDAQKFADEHLVALRFEHIAAHVLVQRRADIGEAVIGGQHDRPAVGPALPHDVRQLQSVHAGHLDVRDQNVNPAAAHGCQGRKRRSRAEDLQIAGRLILEQRGDGLQHIRLVVDDQHLIDVLFIHAVNLQSGECSAPRTARPDCFGRATGGRSARKTD